VNPILVKRNTSPLPSPQFARLTPQNAAREERLPRFGKLAMSNLSRFESLIHEFSRGILTPVLSLFLLLALPPALFALGQPQYVENIATPNGFPIVDHGVVASLVVDSNDWPGVIRAAGDLQTDIRRVSGQQVDLSVAGICSGSNVIIAGTAGKSRLIDRLLREGKISTVGLSNQWESFFVQTVPQPFPGTSNALVICGSDKRGTIYGLYDVSEQIGVSPWHYWADVPPPHHETLLVKAGKYSQGPPSVKYRGIFLNDEAPDLTRWIQEKYGRAPGFGEAANYGPAFYTNLFEVILRCKGNLLWPAMWNNAFNEDDTNNPVLADRYGIVMGTSHQEPMLRAQKEWDRGPGKKYGNWNYHRPDQQTALAAFWREGVRRNKNFESIITLGLRAENDSGLPIGRELTEQIVGVQRKILAEEINPDLTKVPQLWCLYKEVQGFYNDGLRVPDDVTLLWADDNWGNLRRLPTDAERRRSGGSGVYYHLDYHGGPRSYQWLNASPLPKIWDQMSLAKQYGADRIWMVNVGHFKGYELPMEFFLALGWNTERWTADNLDDFTKQWAAREFGSEFAKDIGQVVSRCAKYNGRRKPELLDAATYSLVDYREFETVAADFSALAAKAQDISDRLPDEKRPAFYELVLFPVKAAAQLNDLYLAAARNRLYAAQGRASAGGWARETRRLFSAETNLLNYFNRDFLGGRWDHFMDQSVIGYTSWRDPAQNNLDAVQLAEPPIPEAAALGVAVEGAEFAATNGTVSLPPFDSFNRRRLYFDVFNRGKTAFSFSASPDVPWLSLSKSEGTVTQEERIWVTVAWNQAPGNAASGTILIAGANGEVAVKAKTFNPAEPPRDSAPGFVEAGGFISIEPEHYSAIHNVGSNRWVRIPDYGQTLSGLRAVGPVDAPAATPGHDSPSLEYRIYLFHAQTVRVEAFTSPVLNFMPARGIRYAVSLDAEPPQVVTLVPENYAAQNGNQDWESSVMNNRRTGQSSHQVTAPGWHVLKFWMVDPGVVLQKIMVDCGGLKPSYLGPPESFRGGARAARSRVPPASSISGPALGAATADHAGGVEFSMNLRLKCGWALPILSENFPNPG
jgi:hypothetical protein